MGTRLKAFLGICALGLLAMPAWAQNSSSPTLNDAISGYESAAHQSFQGVSTDWSSHHVVFSKPAPGSDAEDKVQQDPRYWMQQIRRSQPESEDSIAGVWNWPGLPHPKPKPSPAPHRDWAFSLGGGTVAQNMFPAKFSFNAGATTLTAANCTSDFAVYGLNVAGSGTQANLVALDNLYSGTSPTGLCGRAPTVLWAYNVTTLSSGTVTTSPVLSSDGTVVMFIESHTGGATLHILRANPSDGGTVASPKTPSQTKTSLGACSAGSCTVNVALGANSVTNSSPFYDYGNDIVYVGDDGGVLYKITPVLNSGTPAKTTLTVAASTVLTPPILDSVSGNIFVGSSNGILYAVKASTFTVQSPGSIQVGQSGTGAANYALIDGPLVDSSNQAVFTTSMCTAVGTGVYEAATEKIGTSTNFPGGTSWSAVATEEIGLGDSSCNSPSSFLAHQPQFDNTYYTTPASGHLWACGAGAGGVSTNSSASGLFVMGFNAATSTAPPTLTGAASASTQINTSNSHSQCSALTEIYNTNTSTDYLFLGEGLSGTFGDLYGFTISGTTNTAVGSSPITYPFATGGTSGIIIDNIATQAQASSIYFTTLATSTTVCGGTSAYCAVKLTQSGLK